MDRQELLRREVFLLLDSHFIWMGDLNNDFPVKMKVSERFALNQWLSAYPDNVSYDFILDWLDTEIVPWEVIENYPNDAIVEMIDDTRHLYVYNKQGDVVHTIIIPVKELA
jgi:hypothetical protein